MKLNDNMVFTILSTLCPAWDNARLDSSRSEIVEQDIYYNKAKTDCYVKLPDQLVTIECNFNKGLLYFDTDWDMRGGYVYSLAEIIPELSKKSKSKRKRKKHKNQVDELLNRFERGDINHE